MARSARLTVTNKSCWYYLFASTIQRERALNDPNIAEALIGFIRLYSKTVYKCEIAGFYISKFDYSLVVKFKKYKKLPEAELLMKAIYLNKGRKKKIENWSNLDYKKFNSRLFNVSEFMRSIQISFAKWLKTYLKLKEPKLWDGRFYSTILTNDSAALDALLYVESGPLRNKESTTLSEGYYSSYLIRNSEYNWMFPIKKLVKVKYNAESVYLKMLKHRANIKVKNHDIAEKELKKRYLIGCYLRLQPCFQHGLIIGSAQEIQEWINKLKAEGRYICKTRPSKISTGNQYSLRKQKS
jgi:hypothetical protein